MLTENTDSSADMQSKLCSASTLVTGLLLPNLEVQRICSELAHNFRSRVYDPAVTVWLFSMARDNERLKFERFEHPENRPMLAFRLRRPARITCVPRMPSGLTNWLGT